MRTRIAVVVVTGLVASLSIAATASADGSLVAPAPSWYTKQLDAKVMAAGSKGVRLAGDQLNVDCPGFAGSFGAAACIVSPFGCTANFAFTDGHSKYLGTARHCVKKVGDPVVMQVDSLTVAKVGKVAKVTPGKPRLGNDFALIKLDPGIVRRYGLDPEVPLVGGPNGVYRGCSTQAVAYYGHGYGVAIAQGKVEGGLATNWLTDSYGATGVAAPGDSGSAVVLADGRAAGNLTDLIVDPGTYPGSDIAGTRATRILDFLGKGIKLINADGSTTTSGPSKCQSSDGAKRSARKARHAKHARSRHSGGDGLLGALGL